MDNVASLRLSLFFGAFKTYLNEKPDFLTHAPCAVALTRQFLIMSFFFIFKKENIAI